MARNVSTGVNLDIMWRSLPYGDLTTSIAFLELMRYTLIYSLLPVACCLLPKTRKFCTSQVWELLYKDHLIGYLNPKTVCKVALSSGFAEKRPLSKSRIQL
jgi:hypothetical protein